MEEDDISRQKAVSCLQYFGWNLPAACSVVGVLQVITGLVYICCCFTQPNQVVVTGSQVVLWTIGRRLWYYRDVIRMRNTVLQRLPRVSWSIARYVKTKTATEVEIKPSVTACVSEKFLLKKENPEKLKSLIEQQTETLPPDVLKLLCSTQGKW